MQLSKIRGAVTVLGLVIGVAATTPSLAADNGFYIGGSAGITKWDIKVTDVLTSGTVEDNDSGYKVFVGYDFTKNWGVELGYVDLGNYDFKGAYLGTAVQGNLKITGYSLAAVGTFPINNSVGIFGKLGVFSWDAKASASSGSINNSASGSGSNALYGLGLKYNVTKQFSIRGEWDRFHDSNAVDLLSVGVAYKF